ncbi:hypothetical protein AB0383_00090 [Amycolatopsis sp. NPDC051373]|uniref:hypothetical protein n=1 Tax=Amycolatopsis sp. NPDC051373 TaxID=3155801 RepID=UPI00344F9527
MAGFEKTANSDPALVADLVLRVAELPDPPLRLLAGSDAYEYGREVWRNRLAVDEKWAELSRSTDHPDAGANWQQQLGNSLPEVKS